MQLVVGGWPLLAERHKREQATGNRLGLKEHRKERILLQNPAAGDQLLVSSLEIPRRVTMKKKVRNKWNLKSCRCSQL